jgi:hypothetical protein
MVNRNGVLKINLNYTETFLVIARLTTTEF